MKKQQGVAAIILVLVLIPLFGSVFFALESTRYIQKKTRLADATEAAALAVTNQNPEKLTIAENNKESQSLTPLTTRDNLAFAYINSYVRNINQDNIIITPEIVINKNQDSDGKSYYQYNVNVTTTHNSWFVNELIPSFNPTQKITATALARNYPRLTGDQPIDLVFVADFSGSMQGDKIIKLKESIKIISNEILNNSNSNSNRIAFTAFSDFTQTKYDNKKNYTAISYKNNILMKKKVKRKILPQSVISGYWNGSYNYSNIVSTFIDHENKIITRGHLYNFYDIPLTKNQVKLIKKINHMYPNGSTSAYEGILRGAQLLYKNKYKREGSN
ncbi:pilus assembly protein [Photobacterium leiognathi]|uniref:pilus assembly protein n=1 Tax=Photobacterium leiognathi TaxID=553611 RepID=UPI00273995AD|nr:pilus assembly protein TadG-related protein [Photobacterium leiognathi]